MVGKIFVNYRRGDDPGNTGRLFDRLQEAFAPGQLFLDIDNIAPGEDFVRVLQDQVGQCDALLTIIGPRWLDVKDQHGNRRLDNPDDFVRIEILAALDQGKLVIPVLVGEARMPSPDDLPEALRPLSRRNAVRLTHERFRADALGLIKALQQSIDQADAVRLVEAETQRLKALESALGEAGTSEQEEQIKEESSLQHRPQEQPLQEQPLAEPELSFETQVVRHEVVPTLEVPGRPQFKNSWWTGLAVGVVMTGVLMISVILWQLREPRPIPQEAPRPIKTASQHPKVEVPVEVEKQSPAPAVQPSPSLALAKPEVISPPPFIPPSPQINQTPQINQRVVAFLKNWYQAVSGPNVDYIAMASKSYADQVNYFGHTVPRDEVITKLRGFLDLWPSRQYTPRWDTLQIDCDQRSLCYVKGQLDFDARNYAKSDRSWGVAILEYKLQFFSNAEPPKNIMEAGDTTKRNRESLAPRTACDELAANPTDRRRVAGVQGVPFTVLKTQTDRAISACESATRQYPNEARFQYQLGRAFENKDRGRAFDLHEKLVKAQYPAAFDNLGWLYLKDRNDPQMAVKIFRQGVALEDADLMVSLTDMIDRGYFVVANPTNVKVALFKKASELGHKNAAGALAVEIENSREKLSDSEQRRQMEDVFNLLFRIQMREIGRRRGCKPTASPFSRARDGKPFVNSTG